MPPDHRVSISGLRTPNIDLASFGINGLVVVGGDIQVTRMDPEKESPTVIDILQFVREVRDINETI